MGSIRSKVRDKIGTKCFKMVKWQIFGKNRPTLGQIISGTKCVEKNRFFLQNEGVNKIKLGIIKEPNGIRKCQKRGSIEQKFPTIFKYGSAPPPLQPSWITIFSAMKGVQIGKSGTYAPVHQTGVTVSDN